MAQKSYKQFINENSLYQTPAEKMDFESDDAKIINAFYYSFVGPIGYLHAATKKQRVVQYFKSDKQLRVKNINDDNNDVSLVIKIMDDKGFFRTQQTVNEITRFLVKARAGQIDDVNEDIIRGWINQVKPDKKLKALPLIRKKVEEFIGGGSLAALAVELRNIAKRRGFGDGEFYKTTKNLKMDPNKLVSKAAGATPAATPTPTPTQVPPAAPTPVSQQPATQTAPIQQPAAAPSQAPQQPPQSTQTVKTGVGVSDDKVVAALKIFDKGYEYNWEVKEFKDAIGDNPKDLENFEKEIGKASTLAFKSYIGKNSKVGWILESQLRAVEKTNPEHLIQNFFRSYYTRNRLDVDPRVLSAILKRVIQPLENVELFNKNANEVIYNVLIKAEDESLEDVIRPSMRKIVLKHIQEYLRVGLENYDAYKGLAGLLSTRHTKLQDSRYFKYLNAEDISGFVDMYIENPDAHESIPLPSFSELSDRQKNVIFKRVFNSYNNEVYPEDSEPASRVHQLYDEEFVEALRVIDLDALSFYQKSGFVDRVAPSDNSIENMPPDEAKKAYQTKTKFYSKLFGSMDKDDQILFANQNVFANIRNIRSIISSEEVLDETVDAVVQKSLVDSIPEIGKTRYNTNYGLSALAGTLKDVSYQDETPERVYRVFEAVVRGVEERKLNKNSNVYREVFADIETSALLYAETKRDKFEEFYKSLGAGMKKQIARSYIDAKGSATTVRASIHDESALIKPYQKLNDAAIRKALKYNNVSAANVKIPASAMKNLASMEAFADSFSANIIEKQHIAEIETPKAELDRMSADLHRKNRTNRHGRNSLRVLRVLNVAIPKQVEGQKVWDEEHPGQEKIDPMFHGTNAVAASMITRFGFSVGKNAVNGRMLGDGIYGSNAIDKAQLYVGDKYGKGSTGVRGYVFVMDASLGKKNEDYKAAGLSDSKDNIRSPEWCVFTPNSQFRIYKAYEVEVISGKDMAKILEDNPLAQYNESTRPTRFSKFLREYSMDKVEYPDVMTFTFMNGNIPVKGPDGKPTYVDFEDFKPTNKNVSLEPSAYGPTVVITDTEESEDYRFKSPTDLLMQDEELFNKFLELTS